MQKFTLSQPGTGAWLVLLAAAVCTATTVTMAQGGNPINLNATVSIAATEQPVGTILDEITKKTGIKIAYDPEDIRRLPPVSGEFKKGGDLGRARPLHRRIEFQIPDRKQRRAGLRHDGQDAPLHRSGHGLRLEQYGAARCHGAAGKRIGTGVSTDEKGEFTFSFTTKTSPALLEVGFLGMETRQVVVTGSMKGLKVKLKEGGTQIEDVVINGMFSRNKSTFTGSVTTVKGEEPVSISNTNLMTALSAVTPGMVVVQNNALGSNPNAIPEILIRGSNSIATSAEEKAYNNPLIILDGAEISMEELYDLDMYEIERIDGSERRSGSHRLRRPRRQRRDRHRTPAGDGQQTPSELQLRSRTEHPRPEFDKPDQCRSETGAGTAGGLLRNG